MLSAMGCENDLQNSQFPTQEQSPCHTEYDSSDVDSTIDCSSCIHLSCNTFSSLSGSITLSNNYSLSGITTNYSDQYSNILRNKIFHPPKS